MTKEQYKEAEQLMKDIRAVETQLIIFSKKDISKAEDLSIALLDSKRKTIIFNTVKQLHETQLKEMEELLSLI